MRCMGFTMPNRKPTEASTAVVIHARVTGGMSRYHSRGPPSPAMAAGVRAGGDGAG
jgi:hypothetical protein